MDVYPVGLLRDLHHLRAGLRRGGWGARWRRVLFDLRYPVHMARAGRWRAVKSYFNGYLAEPVEWPPGVSRCGTGWTRRRAERDYRRRARRVTGRG